jgi:sugar phosphate isomerase/epimerase
MTRPYVGTGTYILRHEAERDFFEVAGKLAAVGFEGVELLGFFGKAPAEIRRKLGAAGLRVLGDHVPVGDFLADPDRIIAERLEAGCGYLTIAHREGEFSPNTGGWSAMLKDMEFLIDRCRKGGLVPQYHNHGWDVRAAPGGKPYADALLDTLGGVGLCFEPDLGWMAYSSADPADYLRRYGPLCKVIHLKDVYAQDYAQVRLPPGDRKGDPANGGFEFRPTGYGTVNLPRLMPLCLAPDPEWLVIDHDLAYERNPYEDLRLSLEYVKNLLRIAGPGAAEAL